MGIVREKEALFIPVGQGNTIVSLSGSTSLNGVIRRDFAKPLLLLFSPLVKEGQSNDFSSNQMVTGLQWKFVLRRDMCDL